MPAARLHAAPVLAGLWELAGPASPAGSQGGGFGHGKECLPPGVAEGRRGGSVFAEEGALRGSLCVGQSPPGKPRRSPGSAHPGPRSETGTGMGQEEKAGSGAGALGGLRRSRAPRGVQHLPPQPSKVLSGRSILKVLLRGDPVPLPIAPSQDGGPVSSETPLWTPQAQGPRQALGRMGAAPGPRWPWAAGSRPLTSSGHAGQRGAGGGKEGARERGGADNCDLLSAGEWEGAVQIAISVGLVCSG